MVSGLKVALILVWCAIMVGVIPEISNVVGWVQYALVLSAGIVFLWYVHFDFGSAVVKTVKELKGDVK